MNITIYDVEMKSNYELIKEIYTEIGKTSKTKAEEWYVKAISKINDRENIFKEVKNYASISFEDNTEECIYCGKCLSGIKGAFCDSLCHQLEKEEKR